MTRIDGLTASESATYSTLPGVVDRGRSYVVFSGGPAEVLATVNTALRTMRPTRPLGLDHLHDLISRHRETGARVHVIP